ncbi:hypothetical protein [Streptomyces sp. ICBB 8177]|uniref:hypothetical protein n=1 Tax=Streptomyces sp. ICBB 8177 TaxID=563922 RepID=UPI000D679987|nr:hypothetical protein [Streptomyces sp. ICBB 8177]PWI45956.1 hypothetical protein CK485_02090 [Streptomyces sp. ICBB 8177]
MADHHHAYMWLGAGSALGKDGPRRPMHAEFRSTQVVPLEIADWLLKPASAIVDTFFDAQAGADWLAKQIEQHVDAIESEHDREAAVIVHRVKAARDTLQRGEDVAMGWYLRGQRFLSLCLVGCSPNSFRPDRSCPQRS